MAKKNTTSKEHIEKPMKGGWQQVRDLLPEHRWQSGPAAVEAGYVCHEDTLCLTCHASWKMEDLALRRRPAEAGDKSPWRCIGKEPLW